jgi:pyruvate formate lyase activating enzyme
MADLRPQSSAGAGTVVGEWWERTSDGRFRCDLCPRGCTLAVGQRGFCYVRQAVPEGIALVTYGRSSGFCIDPIEKKPLVQFLPGSSVLSFGTAGCNLGCRFCQNHDISKARHDDALQSSASPTGIAAAAAAHGCASVAFTYNDPVIFAEYAIDTAQECRSVGIKTVAVTAGYVGDKAREPFFAAMDATNIDLKGFTEDFYKRLCFARLGEVLDTIAYVCNETDVWCELTTLLIPGENDSDGEIDKLSRWVHDTIGPDVPLHFTAFHPDFKMMDKAHTTLESVRRARAIAKGNGLNFVYTGNVSDPEGASTWCPGCGALVIERHGYTLGKYTIVDGACASCRRKIPGVFADAAGTWGSRRQRVAMPRGA